MTGSINDWFLGRQLSSLGEAVDDEVVEWQAPWDVPPAQSQAPRSHATARAERFRKSGVKHVGGRSGRKPAVAAAGGRGSGPTSPVIAAALRRQIQAAIREYPQEGSKRIAATLRATGLSVSKAQVSEVRRQMHVAKRQRAAANRRTARRKPTGQSSAAAEPLRIAPVAPLCDACGIRVSPMGTCRCS